jgi:hypothetical protein
LKPDATSFRIALDKARDFYEQQAAALVAATRSGGAAAAPASPEEAMREVHLRAYLVDSLLRALGWKIGGPGGDLNVVPEVAVPGRERKYFLDYLGLDREGRTPLMVVETKRPGSPPPATTKPDSRERGVLERGTSAIDIPVRSLAACAASRSSATGPDGCRGSPSTCARCTQLGTAHRGASA